MKSKLTKKATKKKKKNNYIIDNKKFNLNLFNNDISVCLPFYKELKMKEDSVIQSGVETGFPVYNHRAYYEAIYYE